MKKVKSNQAFTLFELTFVILIIALTVAGIITSNILISKAKIATAQNLTRSSPVATARNVVFWLESSITTSFDDAVSDGTPLTSWNGNSSSSGETVSATATSGSAPTYANTINRIHAVRFSGSQSMEIDASGLNGTAYTITVLEKKLDNSAGYLLGDPTNNTVNGSLVLGYSADGTVIFSQSGASSPLMTADVDSYAVSAGKPHLFMVTSSPTDGKKLYINGFLAASSNDTSQLSGVGNLLIGKNYNGEIGEIIAQNSALADTNRQDVEDYVLKKFFEPKKSTAANMDCTGGTITSSGCRQITCSVSVTGSSTTSVAKGGGAISCDQAGYSGTVANSCDASAADVTGTCNCASGYTLSGGVCVGVCSVSVVGSSTTTTLVGGSAISCDQSGYTGTVANSCASSGGSVSGTCSCASGYSLSSGVCVRTECLSSSYVLRNFDNTYKGLGSGVVCHQGLPTAWYRLSGTYTKLAEQGPYAALTGNTNASCFMQFAHPTTSGTSVSGTVSCNWAGGTGLWAVTISATNCGSYFVYRLVSIPGCKAAYLSSN